MVTPAAVTNNVTMTWNSQTIGGASNVRLTNGPTLVDITSIGLAYLARYPTIKDWSVSFDLVYDISDSGQAALNTSFQAATSSAFILNIPSSNHLTGTGYIETFDYSFDPKEVIRVSVSIKGSGLLVYS